MLGRLEHLADAHVDELVDGRPLGSVVRHGAHRDARGGDARGDATRRGRAEGAAAARECMARKAKAILKERDGRRRGQRRDDAGTCRHHHGERRCVAPRDVTSSDDSRAKIDVR